MYFHFKNKFSQIQRKCCGAKMRKRSIFRPLIFIYFVSGIKSISTTFPFPPLGLALFIASIIDLIYECIIFSYVDGFSSLFLRKCFL